MASFDEKELAKIVEKLLNKAAAERRRELLEARKRSDDYVRDIHEAHITVDPATFRVTSITEEEGRTLIEWEAVEYVDTEFTMDEPYEFERSGTLVITAGGKHKLLR
ncbi:MAG: hypothetical protein JSW61_03840 [Candidatus Thorarchaeota archaeon]|nr:MAG: hypothetical protein JSW61_03840 [Candidatus Thorarchaeota archaeon]